MFPVKKDALLGPVPIEILGRVAAQMGEPDRAIAALEKVLSIPGNGGAVWKGAAHSRTAPARSDVRSASQRSALSETGRVGRATSAIVFSVQRSLGRGR